MLDVVIPAAQADTPLTGIARLLLGMHVETLPPPAIEAAKDCLLDMAACALTARDLPWASQASRLAQSAGPGPCTLIGHHATANPFEAAFANATAAHGLIQEDMHPPSSAHIGVVVLPTLLALAEMHPIAGPDFLAGILAGYEAMGRLGRRLIDKELATRFRPTGLLGAFGAAAACARALRASEAETANALALALNTASGLNEWPHAGGTEVFFHAGFAARNGLTAITLARLGAFASPGALDGPGGLWAALGRPGAPPGLTDPATPEILHVYHKPAPACNYVQTPCQATLRLLARHPVRPGDIAAIHVASFPEAIDYPGCNNPGPFAGILQAKMSIQFAVASVCAKAALDDGNFRDFADPVTTSLAQSTTLSLHPEFTAAFPQRQGTEVTLTLRDGRTLSERLPALEPLDRPAVRARYQAAAKATLGASAAHAFERGVDSLQDTPSAADLIALLRRPAHP